MRQIYKWPRYEVVVERGVVRVLDTWTWRHIASNYGGSARDRLRAMRRTANRAEWVARRRVAALRREILATDEGVSRAAADRIARGIEAVGLIRGYRMLG